MRVLMLIGLGLVAGWPRLALGGCGNATYLVVDLSGGPAAANYPVREASALPDVSGSVCRTTELWLRRVPACSFMMGSPTNEVGHDWSGAIGRETRHSVTLTKGFYVGVFEVTQKQYELVTGLRPSAHPGDERPVENVSYWALRGRSADWPRSRAVEPNAFFGRLRARTGRAFDLPTEAQWECACRAGMLTALNTGRTLSETDVCGEMAEAGRYCGNVGDGKGGFSGQHTRVGSYRPNAWGLYDFHGNVAEWCLDWCVDDLGSAAVVDPVGPQEGSWRMVRGGSWFGYVFGGWAACCRAASRGRHQDWAVFTLPHAARDYWGFRVALESTAAERKGGAK